MCDHIHSFRPTEIENKEICMGCGMYLYIVPDKKPIKWSRLSEEVILTTDVWEKFKKEWNALLGIKEV